MKYAGIIKNDIAAGPKINVTFFVQGCPNHCPGCHNPETWAFDGGKEFTNDTLNEIIDALTANGVQRNFSIMGGEPLCQENLFLTYLIIKTIKEKFPDIIISLWTGYTLEELSKNSDTKIQGIFKQIDYLIDGPFIQEQKDLDLKWRGSRNQRIFNMKTGEIVE